MKPKSWWECVVTVPPSATGYTRRGVASLLTRNERPFGLLSSHEQEVMRECQVDILREFHGKVQWEICPGAVFNVPQFAYRVCSHFEPQYAPEPTPAPETRLCQDCEHQGETINEFGAFIGTQPCQGCFGFDGHPHFTPRKPKSEWGEWQECEIVSFDACHDKIRFKKGAPHA